ncbi:MAG: glycoside hydrolase family 2 protein [Dysgonamonadaceae bacterium]|jgi:beta-mannosidase|nr:glycoside hydrolase family 2 protein [Dysgonamonadaceae bacterium]
MAMKRLTLFIFLISVCFTNLLSLPIRKDLNENWKFKQVRGYNWYPATVPGVVHTDLLANKIIDDPFFRLNERGMQWIDKEDWLYETTFDADENILQKGNIVLRFDGLDTYADVSLNGTKILSADNMFREWTVNVKSLLKAIDNKLEVHFHSPIKIAMPMWEAIPFRYQASNDQSENGGVFDRQVSIFTRKAGYHYGWDWGPRLVTSGIWRPVYLEAWNEARIENMFYRQVHVEKEKASIDAIVEISADKNTSASVFVLNHTDKRMEAKKQISLKKGLNIVHLTFEMKKPKLWWSNGLGEPFLYDFSTLLSVNNTELDKKSLKLGVRSLKVIMNPDQYGETFYFELNGVPVFAKGANYIPCDNFLTRVTDSIYEKTILDAVNANMNMLRVWGGGIYENDIFYDLCDKYGIMIWQDFMFGCSMYPAEGQLLENIRLEAIDNVRRLRNHACIGLWAGNNECMDAWFNWGWKREMERLNPEYADTMWKQFKAQYFETLPIVVEQYAPGVCYRPSSPYTDEKGSRINTTGDMHFWTVWQGAEPLAGFERQTARFMSEYGFQSFPEYQSVKKYAPESGDWAVTSEVMMSHQRGGMNANNRINDFIMKEYREPKDFESFTYMSQLVQADAMKMAMETHRRTMPFCMGSLVWQHNDCWPVASWSSRDYYGRWKAQHYFTVKSFADVLISPIEEDGELRIYAISDRLQATSGRLLIQTVDLNTGIIAQQEEQINIPANTSALVWEKQTAQFLNGRNRNDVVVHIEFTDQNGKTYENNRFLDLNKNLRYTNAQITHTTTSVNGGYELSLTSDKFARGVFISLNGKDQFVSDNYMDLIPEKTVKVKVTTALNSSDFEKNLKIVSFVDAHD